MLGQLGQHGGRVRRTFRFGDKKLVRGDLLSADDLLKMPIGNRRALIGSGFIETFAAPDDLDSVKAQGDTKSKRR